MSQQPVTPYIWTYQPETGMTAGAQQDYGSVINWLSADPMMCERIRHVNEARNASVIADYRFSETPLGIFNEWYQVTPPNHDGPPFFPLKRRRIQAALDAEHTAEGQQLAGAGYNLGDGRKYRKLSRDNHPFPINWEVYEGGRWRPVPMCGAGTNATSTYPTILPVGKRPMEHYRAPAGRQMQGGRVQSSRLAAELIQQGPSVDIRSGLTPLAFARACPPLVYAHPFSVSNQMRFPAELSPLYDPQKDPRSHGYGFHGP